MQLVVSKWYYVVLPFIWAACLVAILGKAQREATGSSQAGRVRVLVIQDSTKQQILEEASNLSLDLPVREQPTGSQPSAQSSSSSSSSSSVSYSDGQPPENSTSSTGYRQFSVDSLTLHQQQVVPSAAGNSTNNATTTTTTASESLQHQDPWTELHLSRQRPSWLNVSARFKITGSSIEELPFMFPAEYLIRRAFDSPILLRTKLGIIEGVRSIKFNKNLYTFLSVPYAKPPLGELRFKAPVPVDKWDDNSIYQATKWPPFCVQPSLTLASKSSPVHVLTPMMSEDCLYLNIWSPSLKFNKSHKRPVMVWIHGGAFQYGGISVDENDASALALLGDVVVVTLNYRLGAFGFLNANNPQNAPNNVGMQDQQLALEWVQSNIRQFGGDPQQVTLFGESAGGHSVGLHMIAPRSQPLFKRAILQSGVPVSFLRSYDANSDTDSPVTDETVSSIMMARRLKCKQQDDSFSEDPAAVAATTSTPPTANSEETTTTSDDNEEPSTGTSQPVLSDTVLECMRNRSSLEILKALGKPGSAGFFPTGNDANGVFPHGPIMESFDPDNLKVGAQKDYLIGVNSDEGTFMLHYGMPRLFPSKTAPKVSNVEELKAALAKELEQMMKENNAWSQANSAAGASGGGHSGGAHAHLIKPLMRTSSSMLESFMPKASRARAHQSSQTNSTVSNSNSTTTAGGHQLTGNAEFGNNIASLITDIIFVCPARSLAKTLSEAQRNVYFYLYKHRSSLTQYHEWMGVTHHDEVEFVFGRPLRLADVYSGRDIEMSQRLIKAWAQFAYTGRMPAQLGVEWPKFEAEANNYMILDSLHASVGQRYHDRMCNVYDTVISAHLQE